MSGGRALRIVVLCPHFAPDTAPTGVVMTRIVGELAARGHELHVVTALPWYRTHAVEDGWDGRPWRTERTAWGSVTRVHPMGGRSKSNLLRRALGFLAFSALVGVLALRAGGRPRRVDAVLSMSPPLTLGLTGWAAARLRGGRSTFNVQDVFPDAAVETGAISNRAVIAAARALERATYRRSDDVVLLSDDLRDNVAAKVPGRTSHLRVVPNFVDTAAIAPMDPDTPYRRGLAAGGAPVVMYAGNVGYSQSLGLVLAAAAALPSACFVVNGDGSARAALEREAAHLPNVRFVGYQPVERLAEVLASADVHVVPLRAGLGRVSVPSKTYSILAAGRPLVAAVDPGTEIPRMVEASGSGICVPPDDEASFIEAVARLLADPEGRARMGRSARQWVEAHASPAGVAERYEAILRGDG